MDFVRSCGGRPHDEPALEEVVTAIALPRRRLVRGGEAQKAQLPAQVTVLPPNRPVDLVGRCRGRPVDRAALEVLVMTDLIWGDVLRSRGLSQKSVRPAQGQVFIPNRGQYEALFEAFQFEPAGRQGLAGRALASV